MRAPGGGWTRRTSSGRSSVARGFPYRSSAASVLRGHARPGLRTPRRRRSAMATLGGRRQGIGKTSLDSPAARPRSRRSSQLDGATAMSRIGSRSRGGRCRRICEPCTESWASAPDGNCAVPRPVTTKRREPRHHRRGSSVMGSVESFRADVMAREPPSPRLGPRRASSSGAFLVSEPASLAPGGRAASPRRSPSR